MQSIFGNTLCGVPNPFVPVVHGYPTRFRGPVFTQPDSSGATFQQQTYEAPWNLGLSGCGSCGSGPDGIGADPIFQYSEPAAAPALFQSATGSKPIDALVSGFAGYALGMTPGDKMAFAVVGAFAGWAAGLVGVVGTIGFGVGAARATRRTTDVSMHHT